MKSRPSPARVRLPAWTVLLVAAAAAQAQSWDLTALMHALHGVHQSQATFVERRDSAFLDKPVRITGTLAFTAPDRLVKHSLTPVDELFIMDGDRLIVERDQDGRRQRHEISAYSVPTLLPLVLGVRYTLAGDLDGLRRYYRVHLDGARADWRLRLTPLPDFSGEGTDTVLADLIKEITIRGHDAQLRSIEIVEQGGDRSLMTVTPKTSGS